MQNILIMKDRKIKIRTKMSNCVKLFKKKKKKKMFFTDMFVSLCMPKYTKQCIKTNKQIMNRSFLSHKNHTTYTCIV